MEKRRRREVDGKSLCGRKGKRKKEIKKGGGGGGGGGGEKEKKGEEERKEHEMKRTAQGMHRPLRTHSLSRS